MPETQIRPRQSIAIRSRPPHVRHSGKLGCIRRGSDDVNETSRGQLPKFATSTARLRSMTVADALHDWAPALRLAWPWVHAARVAYGLSCAQRVTDGPATRFTTAQAAALPVLAVFTGVSVASVLLSRPAPILSADATILQLACVGTVACAEALAWPVC